MHTYKYRDTTFICNSDLSGVINVQLKQPDSNSNQVLLISSEDLLKFVADFVRREKIAVLEQSTVGDVLGITR